MPWRGYAEPLSSPPTVPSPPVARRWVRRRNGIAGRPSAVAAGKSVCCWAGKLLGFPDQK